MEFFLEYDFVLIHGSMFFGAPFPSNDVFRVAIYLSLVFLERQYYSIFFVCCFDCIEKWLGLNSSALWQSSRIAIDAWQTSFKMYITTFYLYCQQIIFNLHCDMTQGTTSGGCKAM